MIQTLSDARSNKQLASEMVRTRGDLALSECAPDSPMAAAVQEEINYRRASKLPPFQNVKAKVFKFMDVDCEVKRTTYSDNSTALLIIAANTKHNAENQVYPGETICKATVNLGSSWRPENINEVAVKDWSENSGILQTLVDAGIVRDLMMQVRTGNVFADVVLFLGE